MLEQIRQQMLQNGYRPVQTSIPEVMTFYKYYRDIYYCICIVDDRNEYLKGMGKMGYLIQCSKDLFTQSGHSCQVLGVIVASNVALSRSRAQSAGWVWYVDTATGKLLVFEDQPGEFLDARRCLEDAVTNAVANGYWDYDQYSQEGYWKGCQSTNVSTKSDTRRFQFTPINTIFLLLNIFIFAYLEIIGDTESAIFLYEYGGMSVYKILEEKNYLCLLTSAFMHAGFDHIFGNMLVLCYIGDNVERALGKSKYLFLYLLSAVGANVISAVWFYLTDETYVVSVGASGAIFGVIGALLYMVCKNKGRLEDMRSSQLFLYIALSLYHGFSSVSVNNAAHIGGLFVGFILAMFLYHKKESQAHVEF